MRGYFRKTILNKDKALQSYVIGIAIGDGNLSNPNGRATRLRITCDRKYPFLIKKIIDSLQSLFPQNKVSVVLRKDGCLDVSIYSNRLEKLFGWKAKEGSKFKQNVPIPAWINNNKKYKINCLRGLIETDGTIYRDRGYETMMFRTIIPKLANDFYNAVISLGFKPNIYKLEEKIEKNKYNLKQKTIYNIRLSKNVKSFLDLIKTEKI
jgi:ribosomal protein L39E